MTSSQQKTLCSECLRYNSRYGISLVPECMLESSLFLPVTSSREQSINLSSLIFSRLELCDYLQMKVSKMSQPPSQSSLRQELNGLLSQSPTAYGPQYWQHLSETLQKLKRLLSVKPKKNI